ncbi:IS4 family transposase [bacterium]|nr:IS4 family transposase [bacterium]
MQQIPDDCDTRLTNLIYLMMGILRAKSVQLPLIARTTPIRADKGSIVKRFERFLKNPAVAVRPWYQPFAEPLLRSAASAGTVHLIIDATKVAFGFRLVMVSVAYRRRSLPIAWTWLRGSRGHSSIATQVKLLAYVATLLPAKARVTLVGDSEFGHCLLLENVRFWGWDYALRQAGDNLVMLRGTSHWQRIDHIPLTKGQPLWIGAVVLTKASPYPTHLVLFWQAGEARPWFLATNLMSAQATLVLYGRRMWIEEMFGDMKGHGFDLEASHLRHFLRLSRLTLAVCLVYLWLVALAEYVITHNHRREIDRATRQDLSLFRLGLDFLERRLALHDPIPRVFVPNFCLVSGS